MTQENQNPKTATTLITTFSTELAQENSDSELKFCSHSLVDELKNEENSTHETEVFVSSVSNEVRDAKELNTKSATSIIAPGEVRLDHPIELGATNVLSQDLNSNLSAVEISESKVSLESADTEREVAEPDEKPVRQSDVSSKRETEDEASLVEVMKRDRLQVENVALRQKIRLMLQEEKFVVQQLQDRTKELDECKQQIFSLRHNYDAGNI